MSRLPAELASSFTVAYEALDARGYPENFRTKLVEQVGQLSVAHATMAEMGLDPHVAISISTGFDSEGWPRTECSPIDPLAVARNYHYQRYVSLIGKPISAGKRLEAAMPLLNNLTAAGVDLHPEVMPEMLIASTGELQFMMSVGAIAREEHKSMAGRDWRLIRSGLFGQKNNKTIATLSYVPANKGDNTDTPAATAQLDRHDVGHNSPNAYILGYDAYTDTTYARYISDNHEVAPAVSVLHLRHPIA